jgi:hypothetical protein
MSPPTEESGPQANQEAASKPDADQSSSSARILDRHTDTYDKTVVSGTIWLDIRDIDEAVSYRRVAPLRVAPSGARVFLVVGCLRPNPRVVRLVREQLPRLSVDVLGEPYAIGKWVAALRTGDVLSDELPLGVTA